MLDASVTSRLATITPVEAEQLLRRVFVNAKADQRAVQAYSQDMQEGRWVLNGAPLILSGDGRVLDGRLRLLACLQSGASFDTLVVDGISDQSYETIDSVRKRTLADVLAIRSERHGRPLAAALRVI